MEIFNMRIPSEDTPKCGTDTLSPPHPGGDGGGCSWFCGPFIDIPCPVQDPRICDKPRP